MMSARNVIFFSRYLEFNAEIITLPLFENRVEPQNEVPLFIEKLTPRVLTSFH